MNNDIIATSSTQQEFYYYCCNIHLKPKSTVAPSDGNHRKIPLIGNNLHISYYETVLEYIRVLHFPEKPSRNEVIFACPTLEALKKFMSSYNRLHYFAYKIKTIEKSYNIHYGDYTEVNPRNQNFTHFDCQENAKKYWQNHDPKSLTCEVLIKSAIEIVENLD